MLPTSKVNTAYDTLNLPRDASFQAVLERWDVLRDRFERAGDMQRLSDASSAFETIKLVEETLIAEREMRNKHVQSKSERDLDTTLSKLVKTTVPLKRSQENLDSEMVKKQKPETNEAKTESESSPATTCSTESKNCAVFEKLNSLLRDPQKYLRTVNVLCNVIKSGSNQPSQVTTAFVNSLVMTVEVAISARDPITDMPLANITDDNRAVSLKLFSTIEQSSDILQRIKGNSFNYWEIWTHICRFRNSLYEQDNFAFVKRCNELVHVIEKVSEDRTEFGERYIQELEISLRMVCSKEVAKVIPGRLTEVKRCMTEIFKLTRVRFFPSHFKEAVTQLQQDLQLDS